MNSFALWIYRLISRWLPESRCFGCKRMMLRVAGAEIGQNVRIYSSVSIYGNGHLKIEDDVHIGSEAMLYCVAPASVVIGSCVDIGPGVAILTGSHVIDPHGEHVAGRGMASSVGIGQGAWLGARSMVLPGCEIPRKTIVAAGAVVTRSGQEEGVLLAGVPATVKGNCLKL